MKRFPLCAAVLAAALILSPTLAIGKTAKRAAPKPAQKTAAKAAKEDPKAAQNSRKAEKSEELINIKELYSITPASAPSGEEFKATPVELPPKMHVGVSNDPFAVEMGGVMVNPIPNRVKD